jgi:DNA polymerase III alpha subunit
MYKRLEYSETQKCFHFEDINKDNANTYGWVTIAERLEYELVVVHEMGFDAYFLIVADYINWARKNDIPV